ncbi:DNA-binding protein [Paenibacillus filicis]|uniref:DNA-binding protein n=1 Tax=Paenibacillus gyeongsangnamensis TaxID=3388067 RepID=A0ABT4QJG7_9BACL|nr:DNA-binding protein [Paenibacillus filicis]MCZ8517028.1 DNA-binding protein [Paenibacillus filicis]
MTNINEPKLESDLPTGISKPVQRALARAGYLRLEQFTMISEAEVLKLHGMGPKALGLIRQALAAKGLSFAD